MINTVPEIVTGVTRGDSDAWEQARSLLTDYYCQAHNPRITLFSLTSKFSPSFPLQPQTDDSSWEGACRLRDCDLLALANLDLEVDSEGLDQLFASEPLPELMEQIPAETQLVDIPSPVFDSETGALTQLWTALTKDPLVLKPKAAAALLARLRPAALPLFSKDDRRPWGDVTDYVQFCQDLHELLLADRGRLAHQLYYLREALELPEWVSQVQLLQALVFSAWQANHAAEKERLRQEKAARRQEREEEKLRKKLAKRTKKQRKKLAKKQEAQSQAQKAAEAKAKKAQRKEGQETSEVDQAKRPVNARHLGGEEPADLSNSRAARSRRGRHVRGKDADEGFISTDPVSL